MLLFSSSFSLFTCFTSSGFSIGFMSYKCTWVIRVATCACVRNFAPEFWSVTNSTAYVMAKPMTRPLNKAHVCLIAPKTAPGLEWTLPRPDAAQSNTVKQLDGCSRGNLECKYVLFLVQISMQMHRHGKRRMTTFGFGWWNSTKTPCIFRVWAFTASMKMKFMHSSSCIMKGKFGKKS